MTVEQIAKLHFNGSRENTYKGLQRLKKAGYLKERKRHVTQPSVLLLAGKSYELLKAKGLLADYPEFSKSAEEKRSQVSAATIEHELAVMDVKAAIVPALAEPFKAVEFTTWPRLIEFQVMHPRSGNPLTIKPDGFIRIHEGNQYEYTFYLELDRSTEKVDTLVSRAIGYVQYYRSGGLAVKYGKDRSANYEHPFRVLMVFKSAERRNNVALELLKVPILTQVWLATLGEVMVDPLGPIWIRPLDVRDKLTGTPFLKTSLKNYERYPEREAFIENRVPKHRLLADADN